MSESTRVGRGRDGSTRGRGGRSGSSDHPQWIRHEITDTDKEWDKPMLTSNEEGGQKCHNISNQLSGLALHSALEQYPNKEFETDKGRSTNVVKPKHDHEKPSCSRSLNFGSEHTLSMSCDESKIKQINTTVKATPPLEASQMKSDRDKMLLKMVPRPVELSLLAKKKLNTQKEVPIPPKTPERDEGFSSSPSPSSISSISSEEEEMHAIPPTLAVPPPQSQYPFDSFQKLGYYINLKESIGREFVLVHFYPELGIHIIADPEGDTHLKDQLFRLDDEAYDHCIDGNYTPIVDPYVDQVVCVRNGDKFVRARIEELLDESSVRLILFDRGGHETLPIKDICSVNQEIMQFPIFGLEVKLLCIPSFPNLIWFEDLEEFKTNYIGSKIILKKIADGKAEFTLKGSEKGETLNEVIQELSTWRWEKLYTSGIKTDQALLKEVWRKYDISKFPPSYFELNKEFQCQINQYSFDEKDGSILINFFDLRTDDNSLNYEHWKFILQKQLNSFSNNVKQVHPHFPKNEEEFLVEIADWRDDENFKWWEINVFRGCRSADRLIFIDSGLTVPILGVNNEFFREKVKTRPMVTELLKIPMLMINGKIEGTAGFESKIKGDKSIETKLKTLFYMHKLFHVQVLEQTSPVSVSVKEFEKLFEERG